MASRNREESSFKRGAPPARLQVVYLNVYSVTTNKSFYILYFAVVIGLLNSQLSQFPRLPLLRRRHLPLRRSLLQELCLRVDPTTFIRDDAVCQAASPFRIAWHRIWRI